MTAERSVARTFDEEAAMNTHVPAPTTVITRKARIPHPASQAIIAITMRIPESTATSTAYCLHNWQPDSTPETAACIA